MRRRAVTIVELLVTVAVVAIVVGITIPVLRTVAMKRHDVRNLTSLRSTHQQFRQYANDHQDYFVNAGLPRRPGAPVLVDYGDPNGFFVMTYNAHTVWWPMVLATYTREGFPTWHSTHWPPPDAPSEPIASGYTNIRYIAESGFHYSAACVTSPRFWQDGVDASLLADYANKVRWSDVAFASGKGLLFDSVQPQRRVGREDLRNVVFVDGAARAADFLDPAPAPPDAARRGRPVEWTPHGVLGRDF